MPDHEEAKPKDDMEVKVQKCLSFLMEHFDAVQIFVTKHDGESGNTTCFSKGEGNYYARYGMVSEWVCEQGGE